MDGWKLTTIFEKVNASFFNKDNEDEGIRFL